MKAKRKHAANAQETSHKCNSMLLVALLVVLCVLSGLMLHFRDTRPLGITNGEISLAEYQQLLSKANSLIRKYKTLRGGGNSSAPVELSSTSHLGTANTGKTDTIAAEEEGTEDAENGAAVETYPLKSSARDAIMGMAQDTDPKNLAVFLKSLRRVSNCAIILFVNTPVPPVTKGLVSSLHVKLSAFDLGDIPEKYKTYHPSSLRWILFHSYIEKHPNMRMLYNRIWLTDVRDTYFQSDPFLFINPNTPSFHVFSGVESMTIKTCGWNGGWVRDCFSQQVLDSIGDEKIICSGVSVGTSEVVMEYISMMRNIIIGDKKAYGLENKFPTCERNGVDQGVHNVLVHTHKIPHLTRWDQASGPVANLQAKLAVVSSDNVVKNGKGEVYSVVHQYDRYPDLQKYLFGQYVDWVNTNDFKSEWKGEQACTDYKYVDGVDYFRAKCDLTGRGGATSAASCCSLCSKEAQCSAFTYLTGMCFLKSCKIQNDDFRGYRKARLPGAVSGWRHH